MTIRTFNDHPLCATPRGGPNLHDIYIHVSPTVYLPIKCTFNTPDVTTLVMIRFLFVPASFRRQLRSLRSFQVHMLIRIHCMW